MTVLHKDIERARGFYLEHARTLFDREYTISKLAAEFAAVRESEASKQCAACNLAHAERDAAIAELKEVRGRNCGSPMQCSGLRDLRAAIARAEKAESMLALADRECSLRMVKEVLVKDVRERECDELAALRGIEDIAQWEEQIIQRVAGRMRIPPQ